MPVLTVDNQRIEVPKGTRVIEAAKKLGIDIPYYCYHPGLSIAGNCRMCLVEIEKMPRLQIACHMEAQEGMAVKTNTEKVLKTRQHVLEFLLVNHPLDCPVCDQAGECWLQDYYMKHGAYDSRVAEDKLKKKKAVPVGPTVMLDQERCILCSRCVRFTDEISKTNELGIVNRGDHSQIEVFPDKELNNPYAGNVVDICPVGALTDKDFRFKMRVWYLKSEDSICNGCSRGCNIQIQYGDASRPHHANGARVMRLKPRFNEAINKWWMCDEGRYGYKFHDENRILAPVKRIHGSAPTQITWSSILPEIALRIQNAEGKIGVLLSPQMSNEELFLAKTIFGRSRDTNDLFLVSPTAEGYQDDFLIRADKNPNSKGAELLGFKYDDKALADFFAACGKGEVEGMIIFGQDIATLVNPREPLGLNPWGSTPGVHAGGLQWSVFIGSNSNLTSESSTYVLPASTYAEYEGTFTNFEGRIQKFERVLFPLGESRPSWQILIDLAKQLGIHLKYDQPEEIFRDFFIDVGADPRLPAGQAGRHGSAPAYADLATGGSDIRTLAMPVIPALEQESNIL